MLLSHPIVVYNLLLLGPASFNVLRACRSRAVSGASVEPCTRTFRTTAPQALAALGGRCAAHHCFGASCVLTVAPARLAGSPTSRPFSIKPEEEQEAA